MELEGGQIVSRLNPYYKLGFSYVDIDWNEISVTLNSIKLIFPDKYRVGYLQFRKLKSICKHRYVAVLLLSRNDILVGSVGNIVCDIKFPLISLSSGTYYRSIPSNGDDLEPHVQLSREAIIRSSRRSAVSSH